MAKALRARAIRSFYNVAHVALCISYLFYYIKSCAFCQDLAVFFHKSAIFGGGRPRGSAPRLRPWDSVPNPKTLGFAQTHKGLLERSPLTARTLTQLDFGFCFCVVQIFSVADFRATISGCSEPHSASEMRTFSLSPLPDRSGRKLVDDRDGTIHFYGECRFIPPHQLR